jgi:hypothetical protein
VSAIPWAAIVEGLSRVIPPIVEGIQGAESYPESIVDALGSYLRAQGLDLGPMTPDAKADFGAVESEIDRQLAAAASDADEVLIAKPRVVHDTDPAMPVVPPPSSSSR